MIYAWRRKSRKYEKRKKGKNNEEKTVTKGVNGEPR
jgi:hypothetical protein